MIKSQNQQFDFIKIIQLCKMIKKWEILIVKYKFMQLRSIMVHRPSVVQFDWQSTGKPISLIPAERENMQIETWFKIKEKARIQEFILLYSSSRATSSLLANK